MTNNCSNSDIGTPSKWRHNGNVARLPKALRDKVNQMLEDGFTYPAIIDSLGDAGKGLRPSNLSRWKDGGHQDWLLRQSWLAQTRLRRESAADLSTDYDAIELNHAALQLGTLQMFEALRDLNLATPVSSPDQPDPANDFSSVPKETSAPALPAASGACVLGKDGLHSVPDSTDACETETPSQIQLSESEDSLRIQNSKIKIQKSSAWSRPEIGWYFGIRKTEYHENEAIQ